VVACLPLNILAGIDINLSTDVMQAVKDIPYSNSAKIGLAMKRRFWEEDDRIFGGHLYSNLPIGNFAYPSTGFFGDKGVLLGFYGNGQMAGLVNMPIKDRIEHVLTHAIKVHPQIRAEYETAYCTFWERTPYSLGAFASGSGGAADRLQALGKPDHRIFLGCAAVSGNGGWQEGAVAAAWKQVKQLHERVMSTGSHPSA
jgi:monoamine oxidase